MNLRMGEESMMSYIFSFHFLVDQLQSLAAELSLEEAVITFVNSLPTKESTMSYISTSQSL
eukprot:c621_g1_i1 orf=2-181(-)